MTTAGSAMEEVTPFLRKTAREVLYGECWGRPGLTTKERHLITVACSTALYRTEQLRNHIRLALQAGVTKEEIGEVITQTAFYAGFPTGANGAVVAKEVFDES